MNIVIGDGAEYTVQAARDTIAGYCLAMDRFKWSAPKGIRSFGPPPTETHVPIWAYASYDSVAGETGETPRAIDLFIAGGLNARIQSKEFASLSAVAGEAFEALAAVPQDITFWELPRGELLVPPVGSHSWHLHRAWWLMVGALSIKRARAHKVLHHKRPSLVPLIDNETAGSLERAATRSGHGNTWVQIHDDLSRHQAEFSDLEAWFQRLPGHRVPLLRLRLHDILLWCHVKGEREEAEEKGNEALAILRGEASGRVTGFSG